MIEQLVSIITPTFNCGKYITETIKSVQSQTYKDWELIIIDDCSTDDTKKIVSDLAQNDNRIKYHCLKENSGAAIARNKALQLAQGRWIAFLDSDDLWLPQKIEVQLKFMIENGYSFSYHNYSEIDENGYSLHRVIRGPRHISRKAMISYCWPGCLTVIYDRLKIGDIQIPNIKKNNDYAMWLLISRRATCYLLDKYLASYRKRVGSISHHSFFLLIKWHYKLFRTVENRNFIMSCLCTANNLFWGLFKKLFYVRKDDTKVSI